MSKSTQASKLRMRKIGRAHSELQSHSDLVCRLLLEKKKKQKSLKKKKKKSSPTKNIKTIDSIYTYIARK